MATRSRSAPALVLRSEGEAPPNGPPQDSVQDVECLERVGVVVVNPVVSNEVKRLGSAVDAVDAGIQRPPLVVL